VVTTEQLAEEGAQVTAPGQLAFTAVGVKQHYPGVEALGGVDLEGYV
jgi:ribose transport system ATP-binding protein